ncbi:MAG: putative DNA-binding domain-containing protein [Pseudomonadota bacterium]|nr:putative DNA-binding domain-containing protein [Pseudomonadota bacterium]
MLADFQQAQRTFCDWVRQPDLAPPPVDVALPRLQVYRELLFNNVCSFIDLVYPIARSVLPPQTWQQLCEQFFAQARCESPLYLDISLQFREYLSEVQHPVLQTYPWLAELLQVEWMELHVDLDEHAWPDQQQLELARVQADSVHVTDAVWRLSVPIWVLAYQWPVYRWRVGELVSAVNPEPSCVVVWRDCQDQMQLAVVSPIAAALLELVSQTSTWQSSVLAQHLGALVPQLASEQATVWVSDVKNWLHARDLLVSGSSACSTG